jgi:cation-transporting ATPase 13A3/4/5
VTNQNLCPQSLAATCPAGLNFCGDGTCQKSCQGIPNGCQCGDESIQYFPCAATTVNITHFDPINQVAQVQNICSVSANISDPAAIGVWGDFKSSMLWLSACPVVEPYFTWTEPMWIAVWALMGAEAAILALWAIYKYLREAQYHRAVASNKASSVTESEKPVRVNSEIDESDCKRDITVVADSDKKKQYEKSAQDSSTITSDSIKESEKLKFRGFLNDYFGILGFSSVIVTTLLCFVFLGCIVGDYCKYYCKKIFLI